MCHCISLFLHFGWQEIHAVKERQNTAEPIKVLDLPVSFLFVLCQSVLLDGYRYANLALYFHQIVYQSVKLFFSQIFYILVWPLFWSSLLVSFLFFCNLFFMVAMFFFKIYFPQFLTDWQCSHFSVHLNRFCHCLISYVHIGIRAPYWATCYSVVHLGWSVHPIFLWWLYTLIHPEISFVLSYNNCRVLWLFDVFCKETA